MVFIMDILEKAGNHGAPGDKHTALNCNGVQAHPVGWAHPALEMAGPKNRCDLLGLWVPLLLLPPQRRCFTNPGGCVNHGRNLA